MPARQTIEQLRETLIRDQETFKAQNDRLVQLQSTPIDELKPSDRNQLINWDRSTVSEFNRQLEEMEESIPQPNKEERQIMQALNGLVNLGDHMIARANELAQELNDKLGPVDLSAMSLSDEPTVKEDKKDTAVAVAAPEASEQTPASNLPPPAALSRLKSFPAAVPTAPTAVVTPPSATLSRTKGRELAPSPPKMIPRPQSKGEDEPLTPANTTTEEPQNATEDTNPVSDADFANNPDPMGVYQILGISPTATPEELNESIKRKRFQLHPDKNPDDPDATEKFTEFGLVCNAVNTPAVRAEYDAIATAEQLKAMSIKVWGDGKPLKL